MCKKVYAPAFSRHELTTLMDRELLVAEMQLGKGLRACVATVHLESLNHHRVRVQQMNEIKHIFEPKFTASLSPSSFVACPSCDPVILCGDFNFCSDSNFGSATSDACPLENNHLCEIFPDFVDVWPLLHGAAGLKGYTWDCSSNVMLSDIGHTDPLCRLDRVIMHSGGNWRARSIDLLGTSPIHTAQLPGKGGGVATVSIFPSDHFGLMAVLELEGSS